MPEYLFLQVWVLFTFDAGVIEVPSVYNSAKTCTYYADLINNEHKTAFAYCNETSLISEKPNLKQELKK